MSNGQAGNLTTQLTNDVGLGPSKLLDIIATLKLEEEGEEEEELMFL